MAAQVAAISLVIAGIRWPQLNQLGLIGMWTVMIFGIVSAADYFLKFWRRVDDDVKLRRRRELLKMERQQQRQKRREERRMMSTAASSTTAGDRG